MKRIYIVVLLFNLSIFFSSLWAGTMIVKPVFSARNSTVMQVDSIDLRNDVTRVYLTCNHIAGRWMSVDNESYIESPADGSKWKATDIDGAMFGARFHIPESGRVNLSLDFPALPAGMSEVDLVVKGPESLMKTVGLRLDSKPSLPVAGVVNFPGEIADKRKSGVVLASDTSVLKGFIKGYHPRLDMAEGTLYWDDVITRETRNIPVKIDEGGFFEIKLPLRYPVQQTLFLPVGYLNFYIEPGTTLYITADMEELGAPYLHLEDIEKQCNTILYGGVLGQVNRELKLFRIVSQDAGRDQHQDIQTLQPGVFKEKQYEQYKRKLALLDSLEMTGSVSEKSGEIIRLNLQYALGRQLLDYEMYQTHQPNGYRLDSKYYDFLRELPLNNPLSLAAADYKLFITRFEQSQPFLNCRVWSPDDFVGGFGKLGIALSDDEKELAAFSLKMKNYSDTLSFRDFANRMNRFNLKYKDQQVGVREMIMSQKQNEVLTGFYGLQPSLTYELIFTRQFLPRLRFLKRPLSPDEFVSYTRPVVTPYLKQIVQSENEKFAL